MSTDDTSTTVLAEAEAMLNARDPGAEPHRLAVTAELLAAWRAWEGMTGLAIGTVWCKCMAGFFAMVDIVITAEGRLIAEPGPLERRWRIRAGTCHVRTDVDDTDSIDIVVGTPHRVTEVI